MLGHVAQSVGGALPGAVRRQPAPPEYYSYEGPQSTTFTAPEDGRIDIYATAPGGPGGGNTDESYAGGGGSSGRSHNIEVRKGEVVGIEIPATPTLSAASANLTISLPDGRVLIAGSGLQRFGGTASGFDVNAKGGDGGGPTVAGGPGRGGRSGENNGGSGATFNPNNTRAAGGGGAGGFGLQFAPYRPGNGHTISSTPNTSPGGGGHATNGLGATGRVLIVFNHSL